MGNYMVVFGGNTHDHFDQKWPDRPGLEICYNAHMYFYHLGCHVWLNHTYFTGTAGLIYLLIFFYVLV
jgi:hypothetical protein